MPLGHGVHPLQFPTDPPCSVRALCLSVSEPLHISKCSPPPPFMILPSFPPLRLLQVFCSCLVSFLSASSSQKDNPFFELALLPVELPRWPDDRGGPAMARKQKTTKKKRGEFCWFLFFFLLDTFCCLMYPARRSTKAGVSCRNPCFACGLWTVLFWGSLFPACESEGSRWDVPDLDRMLLQDSFERTIQRAAFEQFGRRRKTGEIYNVSLPPPSPSGVFQAVRLRSGSLRRHGLSINEFSIPARCRVDPPWALRILLVYGHFADSSMFQELPEATVLSSDVLLLLAFDASNVGNDGESDPRKVTITAPSYAHMSVRFAGNIDGNGYCASVQQNSTAVVSAHSVGTSCQIDHLGVFALVVNASGNPNTSSLSRAPRELPTALPSIISGPLQKNVAQGTWKVIAGSLVGGFLLLAITTSMLVCSIRKQINNAKLERMEWDADQGETLQLASVKNSRVPAAADTRTRARLESDYVV